MAGYGDEGHGGRDQGGVHADAELHLLPALQVDVQLLPDRVPELGKYCIGLGRSC